MHIESPVFSISHRLAQNSLLLAKILFKREGITYSGKFCFFMPDNGKYLIALTMYAFSDCMCD